MTLELTSLPDWDTSGSPPVLEVRMNGRFAFVEFVSPEVATKAIILFQDYVWQGRKLKVQRPTGMAWACFF